MNNDNTELVNNNIIKNTHNLYVRGSQDTTNQEPEQNINTNNNNNQDSDNNNDVKENNKNFSLNVLVFIIILATIITTYYYSVLWLIIKIHLVDKITTDIKIITLISGIGFSFYLSILLLKKLKQNQEKN